MRWTDSFFGLKRVRNVAKALRTGNQQRTGTIRYRETASLFQALGCIVQNGQVRILFHISIGADQSEFFDECDVAL
jgi:hypothetical protein